MPYKARLLFFFDCEFDGDTHLFHVMFRYGNDEATLEIHRVGHVGYRGIVSFGTLDDE